MQRKTVFVNFFKNSDLKARSLLVNHIVISYYIFITYLTGVKPEYALSSADVDVCGSAAEMHAVAAAAGLGSAASAASGAQLPTLMHMGYGAPHHRHMLASNQDQCGMSSLGSSYLQHRSAW